MFDTRRFMLILAGVACVAVAAPAEAQLGRKLKDAIKKQMDPKAPVQPAPAPATGAPADAVIPAASSEASLPSRSESSQSDAQTPRKESLEDAGVKVYPGAVLSMLSDRCCGFVTKDALDKVVAWYDEKLSSKGRTPDELAKLDPAWVQQAAALKRMEPTALVYHYLLEDGKPTGRQFQVGHTPKYGVWVALKPSHLIAGDPDRLVEWFTRKHGIKPGVSTGAAMPIEMAAVHGDEKGLPESDLAMTQDVIDRFVKARASEATEEQRRFQEDEKATATQMACSEAVLKTEDGRMLRSEDQFMRRMCGSIGFRVETEAFAAQGAGFKRMEYARLSELLMMYQAARQQNAGNAKRIFRAFWTDAEMGVVERNWDRVAVGLKDRQA